MMKKAALFWSGGKDSAFALYQVQQNYPDISIVTLVTTLNKEYHRISMHGINEELLDRQAASIGIPLYKMWVDNTPTNEAYEMVLKETLLYLKSKDIAFVVFGDIFLEDLKIYRENLLDQIGLKGIFPLWKRETKSLITDFLNAGFRTITCCISTSYLAVQYLGIEIDKWFIESLPSHIDPCGENGEYHTFCFDGPIFKEPISFKHGSKEYRPLTIKTEAKEQEAGFWYLDLTAYSQ